VNWILAIAAVVAAADVPQRVALLRDYTLSQRVAVAAGLVVAALVIAAAATPLLDALDVSAPTMQVGAGMVLVLWSLPGCLRWTAERAPDGRAAGLVPGLLPLVLTPPVGVTVLAVAARNGFPAALAGAAIVAATVVAAPRLAPAIGRRPVRAACAAAGVVLGVALMADGVLAV
jgi:small neutral amino acid transporter SnatA (MarC family)